MRTPCGHRHDTLIPPSPWVMAATRRGATAACLVTEYGALPMLVSRPAADAVVQEVALALLEHRLAAPPGPRGRGPSR